MNVSPVRQTRLERLKKFHQSLGLPGAIALTLANGVSTPCVDKLFDALGCRGLASVSASGPSEFLSSSPAGERQAQANTRSHMCYSPGVSQNVSIRDLRNDASAVVRRVEAGETLIVTVDRRPVATLTPLSRKRMFIPMAEVAGALQRQAADTGLLADLRDLMPGTTDDLTFGRG